MDDVCCDENSNDDVWNGTAEEAELDAADLTSQRELLLEVWAESGLENHESPGRQQGC